MLNNVIAEILEVFLDNVSSATFIQKKYNRDGVGESFLWEFDTDISATLYENDKWSDSIKLSSGGYSITVEQGQIVKFSGYKEIETGVGTISSDNVQKIKSLRNSLMDRYVLDTQVTPAKMFLENMRKSQVLSAPQKYDNL